MSAAVLGDTVAWAVLVTSALHSPDGHFLALGSGAGKEVSS